MTNTSSRVAISGLFLLHGLCFSTWGARIPAIQETHGLSEALLGSMLLALPVGSIVSMPIAAHLVVRFGSRRVLIASILMYASMLVTLGLAATRLQLIVCLIIFGLSSNMVNVSLNTQAVALETRYKKTIMASLHGLWSLAGFLGAALATLMIAQHFGPYHHFLIVFGLVFVGALFLSPYLLKDPPTPKAEKKPFAFPHRSLLILGLIAFFSMICEGAMFDWSGIYFKKVILAEGGWITAGYVAFMTTMAGTRFFADSFKEKFGMKKILLTSGLLVFIGFMISVIFPTLIPALIGFLMIGCGVSAVVPLVLSEAGKTTTMSPSAAIATVSTIGFLGFLLGPPLIGWIAGASSLRVSFFIIAFMGLGIALLSKSKLTLDA